jgi:TetR/AcrR family transcriptional regulator, transcriptional repressor for nem operon
MKVSREQAAANHERIVDQAAKLFRERGFDGIGVADLMKSAGLTHGGFYGQFASKEALMAEACERAAGRMIDRWNGMADAGTANPLAEAARSYLSASHRDTPGTGCLMATLGPEASRQAKPVRDAVTQSLMATLDALTRLAPGKSAAEKRRKAIAAFSGMVGAMVLARAVNEPELSEEILGTAAQSLAAETA